MRTLRNAVARAVNGVLRNMNLAVVRRDQYEALVRRAQQQTPSRDARPLHQQIRTLGPEALGLLAGSRPAGAHTLGQAVLVIGAGREATLLADALRTTGRAVELVEASGLDAALALSVLAQDPEPDFVLVEPAPTADAYEFLHRLRFEQGRRAFTADQLLGGAALLEATNQLVGVSVQPLTEALGRIAGAPIWEPVARLAEREPLAGTRIIELGPADGCVTGSLVAAGAASVMCVEGQPANALKVLVAKQVMGWPNVEVVMDDLHHVDGHAYGTFDLAVAHGIYHQSPAPLRLLENLTTLADTIFFGGYCTDPDQPRVPLVVLTWGTQTVRAQPVRDGAGEEPSGYYLLPADVIGLFEGWGFDVEITDLEPVPPGHSASQYLRLIARRRP
jgi:hypothetical protein